MNHRQTWLTVAAATLLLGGLGAGAASLIRPAQADSAPLRLAQASGAPRPHRSDPLARAADQLGVSETELRDALGLPAERVQPDFAAAAAQLGTTEDDLKQVLRDSRSSGSRPDGSGLDAAAAHYGVSASEFRAALGLPAERPQLDIAGAATKLGVSEDELRQALRPEGGQPGY